MRIMRRNIRKQRGMKDGESKIEKEITTVVGWIAINKNRGDNKMYLHKG